MLKGGLTSAMYTEVLQFFMIVLGFAPVVYLGLKDVGGWTALKGILEGVSQDPSKLGLNTHSFAPDAWTSAGKPVIAGPAANPMGVDVFAMVFGLGFVLSFGYWCTNFLVIQRANGREGHERRAPHAVDCRVAQDALSRAGHSAGHDRGRALPRWARMAIACRR